jgi:isoamylase
VRKLTALRHALPVLRRGRFLTDEFHEDPQVADVKWLSPSGDELIPEQWDDPSMRCFGLVIDGRANATGIRRPASDATLVLVVNAHHDAVDVALPEIPGNDQWSCLIDTNAPIREQLPQFDSGNVYQVTRRSLLLFALYARGQTQRVFMRLEKQLTQESRNKS